MTAPAPLHMLMLPVDERRFHAFANGQGLGRPGFGDEGYAVHALLAALFDGAAPQPFAIQRRDGGPLTVLAYAGVPVAEWEATARLAADADVYRAVAWERAASKPMPDDFPAGRRLRFGARLVPLIRVGRGHPVFGAGAEVDVFLARAEAVRDGPKPDRDTVYRDWVAERLGAAGARLDGFRIAARRQTTLVRKAASGARQRLLRHPDIDVEGTLSVLDPALFRRGLARGLGRHRAFGFGMLLLKPGE